MHEIMYFLFYIDKYQVLVFCQIQVQGRPTFGMQDQVPR